MIWDGLVQWWVFPYFVMLQLWACVTPSLFLMVWNKRDDPFDFCLGSLLSSCDCFKAVFKAVNALTKREQRKLSTGPTAELEEGDATEEGAPMGPQGKQKEEGGLGTEEAAAETTAELEEGDATVEGAPEGPQGKQKEEGGLGTGEAAAETTAEVEEGDATEERAHDRPQGKQKEEGGLGTEEAAAETVKQAAETLKQAAEEVPAEAREGVREGVKIMYQAALEAVKKGGMGCFSDTLSLFLPLFGSHRGLKSLSKKEKNKLREYNIEDLKGEFPDLLEDDKQEPLITEEDDKQEELPTTPEDFEELPVDIAIVQGVLRAGSFVMAQTVMGITLMRLVWALGINPETMTFHTFRLVFGLTLWERHLSTYNRSAFSVVCAMPSNVGHRLDILWNFV